MLAMPVAMPVMVRSWIASMVFSVVVLAGGGTHGGPSDDDVFEPLARRWAERNGLVLEEARGGLAEVLRTRFARLAIGRVQIYLPPSSLGDSRHLAAAREGLTAVARTQAEWASWLEAGQARAIDKGPFARWLRTWNVVDPAALAGKDLLEELGAGDPVRAELEALATALGFVQGQEERVPLVLFPARSEFVEVTSLAGWLHADQRAGAWQDGLATWLEYDADGTCFVTLEYTDGSNDWTGGVSVASRNPHALGELVSQVASRVLLERCLARGLDPALASALSNAMVIDLFDELDTRVDGDVRARTSQGTSVFVPGGNPNGGVLPATSAENRWRGTKGKDHFVGVLAQVQERSGKKRPKAERRVTFDLLNDAGAASASAVAPFLGPGGTRPPDEAWADYLELVRCYGVAFVHWLRTEGGGRGKESARRFAALLQGFVDQRHEDLPALFQKVYECPLSAPNAEALFGEDTLEGRFLVWLSKQA